MVELLPKIASNLDRLLFSPTELEAGVKNLRNPRCRAIDDATSIRLRPPGSPVAFRIATAPLWVAFVLVPVEHGKMVFLHRRRKPLCGVERWKVYPAVHPRVGDQL